jgi:hypothetical protein
MRPARHRHMDFRSLSISGPCTTFCPFLVAFCDDSLSKNFLFFRSNGFDRGNFFNLCKEEEVKDEVRRDRV